MTLHRPRAAERAFEESESHWTAVGDLMGVLVKEDPMESPFTDMLEPPDVDPDPALSQESADALDLSESDSPGPLAAPLALEPAPEDVTTPIRFPVVLAGADGVPVPIPLSALERPAERLADVIEAIQGALVPPPVIAELEALVVKANALEVTDGATMKQCSELYEQLHANEKGIELAIGPVVSFFYRPHQAMTRFRARFAKPVADAKQRLSNIGGEWTLKERRRAEQEQRDREQAAAKDERERLQKLADVAKATGDTQTAAVVEQMKAEVTAPALPLRTSAPAMDTGTRKAFVVDAIDEDAFYKGLADGTIPRVAAPIDMGYLNRQAKDLGKDLEKRYPGVTVKEKGGLTANGRK